MGTTGTRTRTRTILTLRVARIARWRVCFARARTRWRRTGRRREIPEAFSALPLAALCAILSRDALEVPEEDAALTLALRWCEGKTTEEAEEALSHVRFPRISRAGVEAAKASPAFAASAVVRALVDEAGQEGIVDDGKGVEGGGVGGGVATVPARASPSDPFSRARLVLGRDGGVHGRFFRVARDARFG